MMAATAISASLMSLGAIDFGLIVDSSVIMIENCMRQAFRHFGGRKPHLADHSRCGHRSSQADDVRRADHCRGLPADPLPAGHRRKALPTDGTDRALRAGWIADPFADADAGAGLHRTAQETGRKRCVARSRDQVGLSTARRPFREAPGVDVGHRLALVAVCIPIAMNLGAEFMPRLDEGDLLVEAVRLPSASLEDSVPMSTQIEKILMEFPEVKTVFCKTGRPEIANDVMGVHQTDVWVLLHPPEIVAQTEDS